MRVSGHAVTCPESSRRSRTRVSKSTARATECGGIFANPTTGGITGVNRMKVFKALLVCSLIVAALTGCVSQNYSGGKLVEGTDTSIGLALPTSAGKWEVYFFNYLSGFRFGFTNNARLDCVYKVKITSSFCGVYDNTTEKEVHAVLEPTVDEQTEEESGEQSEEADGEPPADGAGDVAEGEESAPNTEERTA